MDINTNIVAYMAKHKVSQNDLAQKLGYTQANLSRILNADDIKVSQLNKICEALNVPPYIFFDNVPNISNEEIEKDKKRVVELEDFLQKNDKLIEELEAHKEIAKNLINILTELYNNNDAVIQDVWIALEPYLVSFALLGLIKKFKPIEHKTKKLIPEKADSLKAKKSNPKK